VGVVLAGSVTARRRRLARTGAAHAEFVSNLSHVLRTPLTNVLTYVDLLTSGEVGPLTPPQADLLAIVERNSNRLLEAIDSM
jgi:signal transduction histidine kinase